LGQDEHQSHGQHDLKLEQSKGEPATAGKFPILAKGCESKNYQQ
jgi:hypothetical protein